MATMAALVTGTVVLAACIPLTVFITSVAFDRAIDGAEIEVRSLAAELSVAGDSATVAQLAHQANVAATSPVAVYLAQGRVVGKYSGLPSSVPSTVRAGHVAEVATSSGAQEVWAPVHSGSAAIAVLTIVPSYLLTRGVTRELIYLYLGGVLLILLATLLADWIGRTIVRPISELENVARHLSEGDMLQRVEPAGPYEVTEVGRRVNELADQIDRLVASARATGADLGHRLRTPLTALRLDIEIVEDERVRATLGEDLQALETAVNRLIQETRQPPQPHGVADLSSAVRSRLQFWTVLARAQQRRCDVSIPSRRVEVAIDRDELEAAVDELVSNIFSHTPEGTGFRVELRQTAPDARSWTLLVEDDAPSSLVAGATSERDGRGTGLGLDIIRRTVEHAGGVMYIGRSKAGGFRVELTFPEAATS